MPTEPGDQRNRKAQPIDVVCVVAAAFAAATSVSRPMPVYAVRHLPDHRPQTYCRTFAMLAPSALVCHAPRSSETLAAGRKRIARATGAPWNGARAARAAEAPEFVRKVEGNIFLTLRKHVCAWRGAGNTCPRGNSRIRTYFENFVLHVISGSSGHRRRSRHVGLSWPWRPESAGAIQDRISLNSALAGPIAQRLWP